MHPLPSRTAHAVRPTAERQLLTVGCGALLAIVTAVACGGGDRLSTGPGAGGTTGNGSPDTALAKISGDSQTATLGTALASPLVVRVTDAKGNSIAGVTVAWSATAGSGSVPATSITDANGHASAQWTLDTTYIGDSLAASIAGHRVSFAAFGNGSGDLGGRQIFPADNAWNADISGQPVDPNSDTLIASCGASSALHPDFGTVYGGAPNGIPYVVVHGTQATVPVSFQYADESDPGPYPVPPYAPIEGGASSTGDRHVLVLDDDHWKLYEMYAAYPATDGASWSAGSGAIFDLASDSLRPAGWTSADAAGLPILPGLVRYDEVAIHHLIAHALRFTCPTTRNGYVAPARHYASSSTSTNLPPMGMRVRLKASVNISGYSANVQVILHALQQYGMFVADNGSAFFVSGAPDPRWNDSDLHNMTQLHGSDFEVVQMGTVVTGH
jgi:hypothetical protein